MPFPPTVLERAFTLAASGQLHGLAELRQALKEEGYANIGQLSGPVLTKQLSKLMADAKAQAGE